jgi:NADH-quinone oxidoreductase subunit M
MVNHGLIIAAMFILIGWIYERRKTWQVNQLRGLQWSAPVLAGIFTLFVMASIGLPGLNGFVGEFLILSGTFLVHRWWAIAATIGVILAAVYLLWMYQQVFHGKPDAESEKMRDLGWNERLIMVPLIVIIVFLGVYPKPVLDRITPSVNQLLAHVDQVTHTQQPPAATGRIAASSTTNAGTGGQP